MCYDDFKDITAEHTSFRHGERRHRERVQLEFDEGLFDPFSVTSPDVTLPVEENDNANSSSSGRSVPSEN